MRKVIPSIKARLTWGFACLSLLCSCAHRAAPPREPAAALINEAGKLDSLSVKRRALAARRLGEGGGAAAFAAPALVKLLVESEVPVYVNPGDGLDTPRREAARALKKIGSPSTPPLLEVLERGDPRLDDLVLPIFAELGDPGSFEAMKTVLHSSRPEGPRSLAALALGMTGLPEAAALLVQAIGDEDYEVRRLAVTGLTHLGPQAVEPLVAALDDAELLRRTNAALVLGRIGDTRAVAPLTAKLRDRHWLMRRNAAAALGYIGEPASLVPLSEAMKETDEEVRAIAASALGFLKGPDITEAIIPALANSSRHVRRGAAEALGRRKETDAARALIPLLEDPDTLVRRAAVRSLSKIGNPAIKPLLEAFAGADPDHRALLLDTLAGRDSFPGYYRPLLSTPSAPAGSPAVEEPPDFTTRYSFALLAPLLSVLEEPESSIRRKAVEALGRIADLRTAPHLIALFEDPELDVSHAAPGALARIGPGVLRSLIEVLAEGSRDAQRLAALTIREMGDARATEQLFKVARSTHPSGAADMALQALGRIGAAASEVLARELSSGDLNSRLAATRALGRIRAPEATALLVEALHDESAEVRLEAAGLLSESSGDDRAAAALIGLLQDSDRLVRVRAALSLGYVGGPGVSKALIAALGDESSDVRESAARSLGELGAARAVPGLIKLFSDSAQNIHLRARDALVKIEDPAVEPLVQAARSRDRGPAKLAKDALFLMGSPRAVDLFLADLAAGDPDERKRAAGVLGKLRDPKAAKALAGALGDSDRLVRLNAAEALEGIRDPAVTDSLIGALGDDDAYFRARIASALGHQKDPRAVVPLLALLEDRSRQVRREAVDALGEIGEPIASMALADVLEGAGTRWDEAPLAREAAQALLSIGGEEAVDLLIQSLRSFKGDAAAEAARALGKVPQGRVVEPLTEALRKGDDATRAAAVEALALTGGRSAVPVLIEALHDKSPAVRVKAAEKLGRLDDCLRGSCPSSDYLIEQLDDEAVRDAALSSLKKMTRKGLDLSPGEWRAWRAGHPRED